MIDCQLLPGNRKVDSPFKDVVCFDWYDGPVEGVTRCSVCQRTYTFRMCAWDDQQHSRVYLFQRLETKHYEQVIDVLSDLEPPKWPIWVPQWLHPRKGQFEAADSEIERLVKAGTGPDGLLVLSSSIYERIEAAVSVSGSEQVDSFSHLKRDSQFDEWLSLFRR